MLEEMTSALLLVLLDKIVEWRRMSHHTLILLDSQYLLRKESEKNLDIRHRFYDLIVKHRVVRYYADLVYYHQLEFEELQPVIQHRNEKNYNHIADVLLADKIYMEH